MLNTTYTHGQTAAMSHFKVAALPSRRVGPTHIPSIAPEAFIHQPKYDGGRPVGSRSYAPLSIGGRGGLTTNIGASATEPTYHPSLRNVNP